MSKLRIFLLLVITIIYACKKESNRAPGSVAATCNISTPATGAAPYASIVNDTMTEGGEPYHIYNISWKPTLNCWHIKAIGSKVLYMTVIDIYVSGTSVPSDGSVFSLHPDTTALTAGQACIIDESGLTDEPPYTWRRLFSTSGQLQIGCNNGDLRATFHITQGRADTTLLNVNIRGDITCHH
jgi:hypothetical protein